MKSEVLFPLLMALVQLLALVRAGRLLRGTSIFMSVVFFIFAYACSLLSSLYWIAYDILRPDTRMPFAANEIGEWALFLLLAASLQQAQPRYRPYLWESVCSVLFMLANTILWIIWSGEWLQDILTGLSLGWLTCVCTQSLKHSGAVSVPEWIGLGCISILTVSAQYLELFLPETMKMPLDLLTYILLYAGNVYFILRTILSLRRRNCSAKQSIIFAFSAFAWVSVTLYMSGGIFYHITAILMTVCFGLMVLPLQKEAKQT